MTMTKWNVYLEAAQLIDDSSCSVTESCLAIAHAEGGPRFSRRTGFFLPPLSACRYADIFKPADPQSEYMWLAGQFRPFSDDAREWRLTALCFAAAMHDAGDL